MRRSGEGREETTGAPTVERDWRGFARFYNDGSQRAPLERGVCEPENEAAELALGLNVVRCDEVVCISTEGSHECNLVRALHSRHDPARAPPEGLGMQRGSITFSLGAHSRTRCAASSGPQTPSHTHAL